MESTTEPDIILTRSTDTPVLYTAYGWIAGSFQPGKKKHSWGELVTLDGEKIKAKRDWRLQLELKHKQKELGLLAQSSDTVFIWKVYPRSSLLRVDLIKRQPFDSLSAKHNKGKSNRIQALDEFRIVGKIVQVSQGKVKVCINRNELPPIGEENAFRYHPNTLTLKGDLPSAALEQIWELKARREGTWLVIIAANPYIANPEYLISLKGAGKRNARNKELHHRTPGNKQPDSNISATSIDAVAIASVESESINIFSNTQQQANQHLDKKRVAIATNDTATPKITLSPGQESPKNLQQQSLSSTKAKISSERKQHYKDKQSLAASTTFEAQQLVPVFRVKANDQIFSGYNSVTLNNRMLRIDGKAVAQAKMVVVVGQPQSIQADGKVSQKGNSAVLISR